MSKNVYGLYDCVAREVKKIAIYEDDLIAFRDFYDLIDNYRLSHPSVNAKDFKVLFLGRCDFNTDTPRIYPGLYEVTADDVAEYLKSHPLEFVRSSLATSEEKGE